MERDDNKMVQMYRINPPDTLISGDGIMPPAYAIAINNPYEISVMQIASDSLCLLNNIPAIQLSPTDVYVRFLPKDSLELRTIQALGTEIFDIPLHYDYLVDLNSFHDPTVPDSLITWQYTVVPFGTVIPNIEHEVIDTCYIPTDEPMRGFPDGFNCRLEMLADSIANPGRMTNYNRLTNTRGGSYPCGTVKVLTDTDDYIGVPVKGVKVKVFKCVKVAYDYTDANGCYYINKRFYTNPNYSIAFENEKGFTEYGIDNSVTTSWFKCKSHSNNGYNFIFGTNDVAWAPALINNCIVDFYEGCVSDACTPPPSNLHVLITNNTDFQGSGAPMLRQIGYSDSLKTVFLDYLNSRLGVSLSSFVYKVARYILPDIMILDPSDYDEIKETVYHELTHACHYSMVGFPLWMKVIRETVRNSIPEDIGYGYGTINDAQQDACELAEVWAFANQRLWQWDYYHDANLVNAGDGYWFSPAIDALYNIMHTGTLNRSQILSQMTHSVTSVDVLRSRLMMEYASQRYVVGRMFAEEGSLSAQTRWRIRNNSGVSLVYTRKWGSEVDTEIVPVSDTVMFSAVPIGNASFYYLQGTYYYPDEVIIRRMPDWSIVFHQTNGVTSVPFHHPFFNTAEWDEVNRYSVVGNTTIRDYIYTIDALDIL